MNWLYYLLEANLYLAAFYGFYRLFLHRETFYSLNRGYLIITSIVAFIIPLLQVGYLNNLLNNQQNDSTSARLFTIKLSEPVTKSGLEWLFTDNNLLIVGYSAIVALFSIRLLINIYRIILLSVKAPKRRKGSIIYVELPGSSTAFSFFNLLFINPSIDKKNAILKHEMVHIQQKHSLDIIFFEIIQILAWFNPITYFIKKDIKLLHEYIADGITTDTEIQKHEYAMFLIQNSFGMIPNQLTNQIFNQSILKRRINMLNKERSAGRARLKLLFALPIAGGMLCMSTMAFTKDYAMIDLYPEKYESNQSVKQDTSKKKSTEIKAVLIKSNAKSKTKSGTPKGSITEIRIVPPPPPVEPRPKKPVDNIKFPPPKVVKTVKFPPVKFPPPIVKPDAPAAPKKAKSLKEVKFPPPIVTPDKPVPPPPPPVEPAQTAGDEQTAVIPPKNHAIIDNLGKNPLIINDGEIVKQQKDKRVQFTAKSANVTPKNNPAAIAKYGEAARDGVIKLVEGTITFEAKPTN